MLTKEDLELLLLQWDKILEEERELAHYKEGQSIYELPEYLHFQEVLHLRYSKKIWESISKDAVLPNDIEAAYVHLERELRIRIQNMYSASPEIVYVARSARLIRRSLENTTENYELSSHRRTICRYSQRH